MLNQSHQLHQSTDSSDVEIYGIDTKSKCQTLQWLTFASLPFGSHPKALRKDGWGVG